MINQPHTALPNIAFIVGMGRSGTTMLTSMLNMNEQIIATPENEFILFSGSSFATKDFTKSSTVKSFSKIFDYNFNNVINIWKPMNLKDSIEQLSHRSYADICKLVYLLYPLANKKITNVKWVIDKNPSYSLHIKFLQKLYPKAKYIILTRDYRDNILSRKKYSDKDSTIYKLAASWNYYYDEIFKAVSKYNLSARIIRYEDLVQNPEKTLTDICTFLGVEFNEEMLNFQGFSKVIKEHAKTTLSESKFEKISNMHSNLDSAVNTERMQAFKNELSPEDIGILDTLCYKHGAKFDYTLFHENHKKQSFAQKIIYKFALFQIVLHKYLSNLYYKIPVSVRLIFKEKSL